MADRLGPSADDRGKTPIKECLDLTNKPLVVSYAGGRKYPPVRTAPIQNEKIPVHSRLGPMKTPYPQGGGFKILTLDRPEATTSRPVHVNNVHKPKIGCSNHNNDELYYQNNKSRKRIVREDESNCACERLIKAVLTECNCSETKSKRVSVFQRLSIEASKSKVRHFNKRKPAVWQDEFPEVTINMTSREKQQSVNPDPDFSLEGRVERGLSQRMSRLQQRASRRRDYKRMHEGLSSDEELSDTCSSIASDDTMSSVGRVREFFAITPDQLAQILQEALAKQREEIRAEIKTEMCSREKSNSSSLLTSLHLMLTTFCVYKDSVFL